MGHNLRFFYVTPRLKPKDDNNNSVIKLSMIVIIRIIIVVIRIIIVIIRIIILVVLSTL